MDGESDSRSGVYRTKWPAGNDAVSEYQRARREGGEALAENPAS